MDVNHFADHIPNPLIYVFFMLGYFHLFCLLEFSISLVFLLLIKILKILTYNKIVKIFFLQMKKYLGKDYSQGINVNLFAVSFFLHLLFLHFRCHIRFGSLVLCPCMVLCEFGNTKINDNRFSIFNHYILGLYVPVNDLAFMDLANS